MNGWEIAATVGGAYGGLELIKYLVNMIFNRKNNARIADSEADKSEFHVLREQVLFLQEQLKEKEVRFSEQTDLVRKQNCEILDLTSKLATAEIEHAKVIADYEIMLVQVKCEDKTCPFRIPPNAYTPPKQDMTIDTYVASRGIIGQQTAPLKSD